MAKIGDRRGNQIEGSADGKVLPQRINKAERQKAIAAERQIELDSFAVPNVRPDGSSRAGAGDDGYKNNR